MRLVKWMIRSWYSLLYWWHMHQLERAQDLVMEDIARKLAPSLASTMQKSSEQMQAFIDAAQAEGLVFDDE